ncbi:hypothetical protein ACUNWD_14085 [Sunxiuqinia sp. A32]|uniref:hypothetical protein n=1 Tax=Sunxiuqinia sp. A32 TaxID=3461496 RepID=UPI004045C369
MNSFKRNIFFSLTIKVALLFYISGFIANVSYKIIENKKAQNYILSSDMEGYYQYLPYVFLKDKESIKNMRWSIEYENGNRLNVFTCGVAIMQLPFFLIAHLASWYLDLETTGYTPVYYMSVFFATLFYVMLGLFFLYKSLRRIVNKQYAFLTTTLIFYATNLFYYTIMSPGMSHAYSFSLISIFIYFVPLFYSKPAIKHSVGVIIPFALSVLIRPTNIVVGLYFILYNIGSWKQLVERFRVLVKYWYLIVLMAVLSLMVFIPQMLYWKYVTGDYIVYSYQHFGFDNVTSPHISTVLVGARNGLFIYTPIMLMATLSLFFLAYKRELSAVGILLIMIILVYLDASWFKPTFSGAAGYRALIEIFPLLSIPLAYFVQRIFISKLSWQKYSLVLFLTVFVIYNLLFSYRYSHWLWWNTDWEWSHFLRLVQF